MTLEELKNYAPLIAIGISILALIVSIVNAVNTNRTSKIALKQFQNKLTNFDIYLIDSFSFKTETERFLIFHITLTNKADSKNSFSPNLIVEYLDSENHLTKLQLPHIPEKSDKITNKQFSFFPKQIFMSEKESISKWLLFSYNLNTLEKNRIDSYNIALSDVTGIVQNVRCTLIKELT